MPDFEEDLLESITDNYHWYLMKAARLRKAAWRFVALNSILAAITTVILGLNIEGLKEQARITALCITAILTVLNAWNSFFSPKEYWIEYRKTSSRLRKLLLKYKAGNLESLLVLDEFNRIMEEAEGAASKIAQKKEEKD